MKFIIYYGGIDAILQYRNVFYNILQLDAQSKYIVSIDLLIYIPLLMNILRVYGKY